MNMKKLLFGQPGGCPLFEFEGGGVMNKAGCDEGVMWRRFDS